MIKLTSRQMAISAMIAALYFALGIAFAPISFGPVQLRVAEALTMLCVFSPTAVWGVTVGCVLTNAYGVVAGAPILGPIDIVLGSAATLVAGYMSWRLRGMRAFSMPVLAVLPPVLLNAVVIGGELCFAITGGLALPAWVGFGTQVGVGQLAACGLLGLALVRAFERTGLAGRLFGQMQLQ